MFFVRPAKENLDHTQPGSERGQFDTEIQVLFQSAREPLKVDQQGRATDLTTLHVSSPVLSTGL